MSAYYNEIDPFAAQWLRELIKAGVIAPGIVDERDIRDIKPNELREYTQCHFFAGIGVWSYALRQAGWDDNQRVWTGSCPCQPFSAAGGKAGFADERHLWPHWHYLISQCQPDVIFGEQVASKDGLAWLDLVQTDLEGTGYTSGAVDICAAGVGAPHIRQRLYIVAERLADSNNTGSQRWVGMPECTNQRPVGSSSMVGGLADTPGRRFSEQRGKMVPGEIRHTDGSSGAPSRLANSDGAGLKPGSETSETSRQGGPTNAAGRPDNDRSAGPTNGYWADVDWLGCRDGKFRPVEPGTFPLVDGAPARVGRLRGYGNAINAEVAAAFVEAYLACR